VILRSIVAKGRRSDRRIVITGSSNMTLFGYCATVCPYRGLSGHIDRATRLCIICNAIRHYFLVRCLKFSIMATKTNTRTTQRSAQEEGALMELFVSSLKDINWAEKHLVKALKKMAKAASSGEVAKAFEDHMAQTEVHVERLAQVFELLGKKPTSKKCEAMDGLISEADELIEETEEGSEVRDVALIAAAQKVEHYEIATYGTLKTLAGTLGLNKVKRVLEQTLEEEKQTDAFLTEIAEDYVNQEAAQE